ncbi:MAG: triose-phosphate isomerase [Candidatus Babeliales bacterium]
MAFLYVANWKMNFTCAQAGAFITNHRDDLIELARQHELVLCPSYEALYPIAQHIANTPLHLGAQNCSMHHRGAYTGDVSAESLRELGCTYCIVGHSEQRHYHQVTDREVAAQVERLLTHQITPIICIGETQEQYKVHTTRETLLQQLNLVTDVLNQYNQTNLAIYIAYEPVWSIGTGVVAPITYLQEIFAWLHETCATLTTQVTYRFLYGGSINEDNAPALKSVNHLGGFLIGNASLDFKKIKNIVSC